MSWSIRWPASVAEWGVVAAEIAVRTITGPCLGLRFPLMDLLAVQRGIQGEWRW